MSIEIKKYNMLTIVSLNLSRSNKNRKYYNCLCDCGKETVVRSDQLKNGRTKSCGCLKRAHMNKVSENNVIYLTGKKIGWLKVIKATGRKANGETGNYFWLCECKCGNYKEVRSSYLRNGQVLSCGCYHKMIINGHNNPNYKPTLTIEHRKKTRNQLFSSSQSTFRNRVLKRDDYACKICDSTKPLVAHHLNSYNSYEVGRFDINNGITLCESCHRNFHKEYGYGDNTTEQFENFKGGIVNVI